MKKLMRTSPKGGLRAVEINGRPGIALKVLRYGVVDDYGSLWEPNVLRDGLTTRWPQLAWAHDWADVIGRAVSADDPGDGPELEFYLDDFDAVPRARQAYAQVQSGTIDDCSVGFAAGYEYREPTAEEKRQYPGVMEIITKAELNEVSLVLRGAVPGAKVLTVRSAPGCVIEAETAGQILAQLQAGALTLKDALQAVEDASVERPTEPETVEEDTPTEEQPEETPVEVPESADTQEDVPEAAYGHEIEELLAEMDDILDKDAL